MNYYQRQIQLWGKDVQESLRDKKIAIIGCGGLGCSIAIALSGSGIGQIDLIDFDTVEVHNIHRQIAFDEKSSGKQKANVLKEWIEKRNSDLCAKAFTQDFESYVDRFDGSLDLIIDATDNLPTRAKIDEFAAKLCVPWIYGSVEEFHGQVAFFDKARFEEVLKVSDKKPEGIAAPIVMQIASFQANLALRYLAGLAVAKDVLNYLFFDTSGQFQIQSFKLPKASS